MARKDSPEYRAYQAAYRKAHREKARLYAAEYRLKHRDKILECSRKNYRENRERYLEYRKKYREAHSNSIKEAMAKYYAEHKDHLNEYSRKYHAKHRETLLAKKRRYYAEHAEEFRKRQAEYRKSHIESIRARMRRYKGCKVDPYAPKLPCNRTAIKYSTSREAVYNRRYMLRKRLRALGVPEDAIAAAVTKMDQSHESRRRYLLNWSSVRRKQTEYKNKKNAEEQARMALAFQ